MKPEQAERFFVEGMFKTSVEKRHIEICQLATVEKLTGDASTRRYYRVKTDRSPYVVCLDDPLPQGKDESSFVKIHRVFEGNDIRVPRIHDKDLKKGYLLEEDLGDNTLLKRLSDIDSIEEEYELYIKCLNQLLKIHHIDTEKYQSEDFTQLAFDQKKLMSEVDFTIKYFIKKFLKYKLSTEKEKIIKESFEKICSQIVQPKRLLAHRDYHSRNIMVVNEETVIIDFQDARMGIPQYDLVSLLEDSYYNINIKNVDKLKKYYWKNLKADLGYNGDFERFNFLYDMMTLQRVFKAIGSFSYIYDKREDVRYIKYIGTSFEKLKKVLLRYPEYSQLRILLSRIYYEN